MTVTWYSYGSVSGFKTPLNVPVGGLNELTRDVTRLSTGGTVDANGVTRLQYPIPGDNFRRTVDAVARLRWPVADFNAVLQSGTFAEAHYPSAAMWVADAGQFAPGYIPKPSEVLALGAGRVFVARSNAYVTSVTGAYYDMEFEIKPGFGLQPNRKYWVVVAPTNSASVYAGTTPTLATEVPYGDVNTVGRCVSVWGNRTPKAPLITAPTSSAVYASGESFTLSFEPQDPDAEFGGEPDCAGVQVQYAPQPTEAVPSPEWVDMAISSRNLPLTAGLGWYIDGSVRNEPADVNNSGAYYFWALQTMKVRCGFKDKVAGEGILPAGRWQIRLRTFDYGHPYPMFARPLASANGDLRPSSFSETNASPWSKPIMVTVAAQVPPPVPLSPISNTALSVRKPVTLRWKYRNTVSPKVQPPGPYAQARQEVQIRPVASANERQAGWTTVSDTFTANPFYTLEEDPAVLLGPSQQYLANGGFEPAPTVPLSYIHDANSTSTANWTATQTNSSGGDTPIPVTVDSLSLGVSITGVPSLTISKHIPNALNLKDNRYITLDWASTTPDYTQISLVVRDNGSLRNAPMVDQWVANSLEHRAVFQLPPNCKSVTDVIFTVFRVQPYTSGNYKVGVHLVAYSATAPQPPALDGWTNGGAASASLTASAAGPSFSHSGTGLLLISGSGVGYPTRTFALQPQNTVFSFSGWTYMGDFSSTHTLKVEWLDANNNVLRIDTKDRPSTPTQNLWLQVFLSGMVKPPTATQARVTFLATAVTRTTGDRYDDFVFTGSTPGNRPFIPRVSQYEWRVRATDVSGASSDWSQVARFYLVPAPASGSLLPVPGETIDAATLGTGKYRAFIYRRGGIHRVAEITQLAKVRWNRVRDEISDASIEVSGWDSDGGAILRNLQTWAYELVLFRKNAYSEDRVWEGPITLLTYKKDSVTIEAKDVMVYAYRRIVKQIMDDSKAGGLTVTDRAMRIIQNAFAPDDPNVLPYLQVLSDESDSKQYRNLPAFSRTAYEEVDDMAQNAGLDYTCVGRAILLWGTKHRIGTLPEFRDSDLGSSPIVSEYGMSMANFYSVADGAGNHGDANRLPVNPKTPLDTPQDSETAPVLTDPVYGLVEMLSSSWASDSPEDAGTYSQAGLATVVASFTEHAERSIADRFPPPVVVRVPDNTTVHPDTVISINHLVPGVVIPLRSESTLRTVAANQKLDSVSVDADSKGETISLVMSPFAREDTVDDDPDSDTDPVTGTRPSPVVSSTRKPPSALTTNPDGKTR